MKWLLVSVSVVMLQSVYFHFNLPGSMFYLVNVYFSLLQQEVKNEVENQIEDMMCRSFGNVVDNQDAWPCPEGAEAPEDEEEAMLTRFIAFKSRLIVN